MEPRETELRKLIGEVMPELQKLRAAGYTFQQIAGVLNNSGICILPSDLRSMFSEFLLKIQCELIRDLDEQLALLEDLRLVTSSKAQDHPARDERPSVRNQPEWWPYPLTPNMRCYPFEFDKDPLPRREGVPEVVYKTEALEHPAIDGLILTLDERLYSGRLLFNDKGVPRLETVKERAFRVKWQKPAPITHTTTGRDFVEMNTALFVNVGRCRDK